MTTAETFKILDELNAALKAIARTQTYVESGFQLLQEQEHQAAQLAEDEEDE